MEFVCGGLASITAELATFPIDMAKTRLQLQGQVKDVALKDAKYKGMIHTISTVIREEGATALYRGISPAILRQSTYGTIKIGFYQFLKTINPCENAASGCLVNFINGMLAGGSATVICSPTDLLKVRLQAQSSSNNFAKNDSIYTAFSKIVKTEGVVRGLYQGVIPNAVRSAIVSGAELSVYDLLKGAFVKNNLMDDSPALHLASSAIAGLTGAVLSNPFDVMKSRLMNQRNIVTKSADHRLYKGLIDCAATLLRTEGFFAFYKGLIPTACRLVPWNVTFFITFEQYRNLLIKKQW